MKSFLKPLFLLVFALGMGSTVVAQNKQITIKKEVDEHGNIISYDSTVVETSGNMDPEQMERFQREMDEMSSQLKDQMAEFKLEMESSMKTMQEEMSRFMEEDFNMDQFNDLFDMEKMQSLVEEQMKMFDELFDSKDSAKPSEMREEQMY